MLGLGRSEIRHKIHFKLSSLTGPSQNSELKKLAEKLAECIAEVIEDNNAKIEKQINNIIEKRIEEVKRNRN